MPLTKKFAHWHGYLALDCSSGNSPLILKPLVSFDYLDEDRPLSCVTCDRTVAQYQCAYVKSCQASSCTIGRVALMPCAQIISQSHWSDALMMVAMGPGAAVLRIPACLEMGDTWYVHQSHWTMNQSSPMPRCYKQLVDASVLR